MISKNIITNESSSEYLHKIKLNDLFISFHHPSGKCFGVFLVEGDCKAISYEKIYQYAFYFFKQETLNNVEIKIIGGKNNLIKFENFIKIKNLTNIKNVIKDSEFELMFLPKNNKVRISSALNLVNNNSESNEKTIPNFKLPVQKIKVMIIDDSKTIRTILSHIILSSNEMEVCSTIENPLLAIDAIKKEKPDVITLDIHMPEMDGLTLLKKISKEFKIPVIMISSLNIEEGPKIIEALENGAFDFIQKPEMSEINDITPIMLEKIKLATINTNSKSNTKSTQSTLNISTMTQMPTDNLIITIGASTGGVEAIKVILSKLPKNIPPIVIVQHIPAHFSESFAKRLNEVLPFEVREAKNGDEIKENLVLIAPGGYQMKIVKKQGLKFIEINDDLPVNRFKPSVDYLFNSISNTANCPIIAILLTGMGKDGAIGLLELKNKGAITIAQDEKSCIVFGMPKEAISIGAAQLIVPLNDIANSIIDQANILKNPKNNIFKKAI